VIAKITRGARSGDIAAYLHGPGKANEHRYDRESGGAVIGGNLGREGDRDGKRWAQDLRAAASTREDIKNPIWHTSLRSAPGDRKLSDAEWADAGQQMAEKMGYSEHPWVMVRHGDDHVHIVTSRVSETGDVWHARQDYRQAQRAATDIEKEYGLTQAPRVRENPTQRRTPKSEVNASQQQAATNRGRTTPAVETVQPQPAPSVNRRTEAPEQRPTQARDEQQDRQQQSSPMQPVKRPARDSPPPERAPEPSERPESAPRGPSQEVPAAREVSPAGEPAVSARDRVRQANQTSTGTSTPQRDSSSLADQKAAPTSGQSSDKEPMDGSRLSAAERVARARQAAEERRQQDTDRER
jgi:hypothetical protein